MVLDLVFDRDVDGPRGCFGVDVDAGDVNVVACFGLGLVGALYQDCTSSRGVTLLIGVGFFGSLSTFSTFILELLNELRLGRGLAAFSLASVSILFGLVAAALGYGLGMAGAYD